MTSRRTRNDYPLWPALLLLLASALIPTVCLVWLLNVAVSNERLAVREKLMQAYAANLEYAPQQADGHFEELAKTGQDLPTSAAAGERFLALVRGTAADSVVILEQDRPIYPDTEEPSAAQLPRTPPWQQAARLEFQEDRQAEAAEAYRALASAEDSSAALRVLALQAAARCLEKTGDRQGAQHALQRLADEPELFEATGEHGRPVALAGLLRYLELSENDPDQFNRVRAILADRLARYDGVPIPSAQRRFLLRQLIELAPDGALSAQLQAETLAAQFVEEAPPIPAPGQLGLAGPAHWAWRLPEGDALLLFETPTLARAIEDRVNPRFAGTGARAVLLPPDTPAADPALILREDAGAVLTGWRWAVAFDGPNPFTAAAERQVLVYAWTALLGVAVAIVLTLLAARVIARRLREAQLKNELIAVVSHELKTPLASMRALVDTLREGRCPTPEQQAEYLDLMAAENSRLSDLIDTFLAFSRAERTGTAYNTEPVDLAKTVEACVDKLRARLESAGFTIEIALDTGLPPLHADANALETVLLNLLDNAIKYASTQRHIQIAAGQEGAHIAIAVADRGIGMNHHEAKHAFDSFYQANRNLNRAASGCGLGLSIVKMIVEAHKGRTAVESTPGNGATFTVHWPIALAGKE